MKSTTFGLAALLLGPAVAQQFGFGRPEPNGRPDGQPAPNEDFPWRDPFKAQEYSNYAAACSVEETFPAAQFLLDDLTKPQPQGLSPYADALRRFFKDRPYPGGWDGIDPHGYDRHVIMMNYSDVPVRVRQWIEEQKRSDSEYKDLFAVYERALNDEEKVKSEVKPPKAEKAETLRPLDKKRVMIFAPGAIYEILPLWVAHGAACESTLANIDKYTHELSDGSVVGWVTRHSAPKRSEDERNMVFTVKAQHLKQAEDAKDEL